MNERFLDRPAIRSRPVAVVFFRNILGDQDRVLTHRAHAVRQLFCSVELHFFLLAFGLLLLHYFAGPKVITRPSGITTRSAFQDGGAEFFTYTPTPTCYVFVISDGFRGPFTSPQKESSRHPFE